VNFATLQAIVAATLAFGAGILHLYLSRVPRWRWARSFSAVALSAAVFSSMGVLLSLDGIGEAWGRLAAQAMYAASAAHVVAWLVFVFGGARERQAMPLPVEALCWLIGVAAVFFAATGLHVVDRLAVSEVAWAHSRRLYLPPSGVGVVYSIVLVGSMAFAMGGFLVRAVRRREGSGVMAAGLVVVFACSFNETLIVHGVYSFISLLDLGVAAGLLPASLALLQGFAADSRRLGEFTAALEEQVHERTAERDRAREALVLSERLASMGRLAAGVGHEINNPLTYLQLGLEVVDEHLHATGAPAAVREALHDAQDGARRIAQAVEGLRTYARGPGDRRRVDAREAVRSALRVAASRLGHVARVEVDADAVAPVLADEPRLVQALVNLLVNAGQAVEKQGGTVSVRVRSEGGDVLLEVADTGVGMVPEVLQRAAEPYFTTKADVGGLGLGLFVTHGIVEALQGRLELDSSAGGGTRVRIRLPAAPADFSVPAVAPDPAAPAPDAVRSAPEPVRTATPEAAPASPGRLLLVDDEELVGHSLARALQRYGWNVSVTTGADRALEEIRAGPPFDAVLCDLLMPGRSGIDLAEELARTRPDVRARMLFLTGGAVGETAEAFLLRPDVRHLVKPVETEALAAALDEVRRACA